MKKTLVNLFNEAVREFASDPFLWERTDKYHSITYSEGKEKVLQYGAGWLALGLKKGDTCSFLCEGCNAWILGELSLIYAGAINVPISIKLKEAGDILFRINHSESKYVFVSKNQLKKIRSIKSKITNVSKYIVVGEGVKLEKDEISLSTLAKLGIEYEKNNPGKLKEISESINEDDIANISYTSGTTANPKGVMLTNRNITSDVEVSLNVVPFPKRFRTLLILPLDHCYAHVTGFYAFIYRGGEIATVPSGKNAIQTIRNIPIALKEFNPDAVMTVPALAKSLRKAVIKGVNDRGTRVANIFNFAIRNAIYYNREGYNRGKGGGRFLLYPMIKFFDIFLFKQIRNRLSSNLKFFIDGGAYLDIDMQKFWYAVGIPMFQGYGLSEASPVISSSSNEHQKLGTSGKPADSITVVIRDDKGNELPNNVEGEITIKGENVMKGYWKNPEATAEVLKDGWLYTGDLGSLDEDGFLNVYGRSKSLLIGNDGEKYSPEGIEESIEVNSKYIHQIFLHNNQNIYTVGLIVPNIEGLKSVVEDFKSDENIEKAINLIQSSLDEYKNGGRLGDLFLDRWLPSTFAILKESFNEQNHMMNSTLKIVRRNIESVYADKIDFLLTPKARNPINEVNIEALRAYEK